MIELECVDCNAQSSVEELPIILKGKLPGRLGLRVDLEDLRCTECGGKIRKREVPAS